MAHRDASWNWRADKVSTPIPAFPAQGRQTKNRLINLNEVRDQLVRPKKWMCKRHQRLVPFDLSSSDGGVGSKTDGV